MDRPHSSVNPGNAGRAGAAMDALNQQSGACLPASSEILRAIRTQTRDWHSRVELLVPVFDDGFTLFDYQRLLERFYGFYSRFEVLIEGSLELRRILPDWRSRLKVPWLKADLLWLGLNEEEIRRLPVCSLLPELPSIAAMMGALYVTEGSTLGAQLICRRLAQSLHLTQDNGANFFAGHGERTGPKWRSFTTALCEIATPENQSLVIASAIETFKAMSCWLSPAQVGHTMNALDQMDAQ